MCSPASAIGSYKSGMYNSDIAKQNAQLAETSAQSVEQQGAVGATRYKTQVKNLIGTSRATIAANGLEASGSALRVLGDTAAQGELNALTIRNNAARQAFGYRVQGAGYLAQGQLALMQGQFGAISSLLGGAAQGASEGYGFYSSLHAASAAAAA